MTMKNQKLSILLCTTLIVVTQTQFLQQQQQQQDYFNFRTGSQQGDYFEAQPRCPSIWLQLHDSCYRFIKSPLRSYYDARKICQAYDSDLVSLNSAEEHAFITQQLTKLDPQHRKWYVGIHQTSPGYWSNEADGTQLISMENAFLPNQNTIEDRNQLSKDYLAYSFSPEIMKWGFEIMRGDELLCYVCETSVDKVHYLEDDDRTYVYGVDVDNPLLVPRGPFFIRQPVDRIYDLSTRQNHDIQLR